MVLIFGSHDDLDFVELVVFDSKRWIIQAFS